MELKQIIHGYKTHDRKELSELNIVMKYILSVQTQMWTNTFDVNGKVFQDEGETIQYIINDEEFIKKRISKNYYDFFKVDDRIAKNEHTFINFIRDKDQYFLKEEKKRRRWYNQMNIEHD